MTQVTIKSSESGNKLIFSNRIGEYFDVRYEGPSVQATRTVWAYEDFPSFAGFFQKITTHWKGWEKQIEWQSIEGELSLSATSDHLGHALIIIEMTQYDDNEQWKAYVSLRINTTQASDIVKGLKGL